MPPLFDEKPLLKLADLGIKGNPAALISQSPQGEHDWLLDRCGLVTASNAHCIVTPKGKAVSGEKRSTYMHDLIYERLTGQPVEHCVTLPMTRGTELEPRARAWYELATGRDVIECGFIYGDESKRYGVSPDGLPGDRGLEVKCPGHRKFIRTMLDGGVPADNQVQVHFQSWVLSLPVDFVQFTPEPQLANMIVEVPINAAMHDAFAQHIPAFCDELDAAVEEIRGR